MIVSPHLSTSVLCFIYGNMYFLLFEYFTCESLSIYISQIKEMTSNIDIWILLFFFSWFMYPSPFLFLHLFIVFFVHFSFLISLIVYHSFFPPPIWSVFSIHILFVSMFFRLIILSCTLHISWVHQWLRCKWQSWRFWTQRVMKEGDGKSGGRLIEDENLEYYAKKHD